MKIKKEPVYNEWRQWFAWRPIKTEDCIWIWLEIVERKIYEARIPNVSPSSWIIYRVMVISKDRKKYKQDWYKKNKKRIQEKRTRKLFKK